MSDSGIISFPPIIAMAPNAWDSRWMNRQHLLSRLAARGWPVVYSTGALSMWDRGSPRWKTAPLVGRCQQANGVLVDRPGKWLPRWPRFSTWDRVALEHHANRLAGAGGTRWKERGILFLFEPSYFPYVEFLRPRFLVFHVYDVYLKMGEFSAELERMLIKCVDLADLLTAASEAMKESLPGRGPNKARVLHNGADSKRFCIDSRDVPCPPDLQEIPHPRIANVGTINKKMDLRLIVEVATRRPDWHWVLVGTVDESRGAMDQEARDALKACRNLRNVHFLPEKPMALVPHYVCHMDVTTVCYRVRPGDWVTAGYPLKLNEYLAAGKPVVATATDVIRSLFSSVVDIASTADEWVVAIDRALTAGGVGTVETRRALARQNTWDNRVDVLETWLREMIQ